VTLRGDFHTPTGVRRSFKTAQILTDVTKSPRLGNRLTIRPEHAALLKAFVDDSADQTQQRVFCVAGVVGRDSDWAAIEDLWARRLGGRVFHATDCESDRGDFATASHVDNQRLYADLVVIIRRSKIFGYVHALDLTASKAVFADEMLPDSPFYFCLSRVLNDCARYAYLSIPQEQVHFTFDARPQSQSNTIQLYECARLMNDWKFSGCLADDVSLASRRLTGVQVADLLAREGMKVLDREVGVARPLRASLMTLLRSRRFKFKMYGRDYLEQLKSRVRTLEGAFSQSAYHEWLRSHGHVDSHHKRIAWLATQPDAPKGDNEDEQP
jgi:hypothetical protein